MSVATKSRVRAESREQPPKPTALPSAAEADQLINQSTDQPATRSVTLTVPMAAPDPTSYIATCAGRINMRLRPDQLDGFRQLHAGLRLSNATFADGRPVDGAPDVLRWLCEQMSQALDDQN